MALHSEAFMPRKPMRINDGDDDERGRKPSCAG